MSDDIRWPNLTKIPNGQMCETHSSGGTDRVGKPVVQPCPNRATRIAIIRSLPWPSYVCDPCYEEIGSREKLLEGSG